MPCSTYHSHCGIEGKTNEDNDPSSEQKERGSAGSDKTDLLDGQDWELVEIA
jgi:hypothetical protein